MPKTPSQATSSTPSKRKRSERLEIIGPDVRFVLFCPWDDPFYYMRVDRHVLDEFDCRSAKMCRCDPPHRYYQDMPVWDVNIGRSMLHALVKSLIHHEFILPKDGSYQEAVCVFREEGIGVPGNDVQEPSLAPGLLHPSSAPFGMYKAEESHAEYVSRVCTMVANAIVEWPRPRIMLTETLQGKDTANSCSSSRFWVRFASCPRMEKYGGDELYALAKKRPGWLQTMLGAIGYVHCELVKRGLVDARTRDEPSFSKLADHLKEKDTTRYFVSVKRDMPRHHRDLNREVIRHADRWAAWVLTTVADHGSAHEMVMLSPNDERKVRRGGGGETTQYARAAIALAEREMKQTPNCYKMFNGECSDDDKKGVTPERKVLEKALNARGAKVVRWRDDVSQVKDDGKEMAPLVFPPSFYSHLMGDGPCALIEMKLG